MAIEILERFQAPVGREVVLRQGAGYGRGAQGNTGDGEGEEKALHVCRS